MPNPPDLSDAAARAARCVLVADDSPVARLAVTRRLRAERFAVVEASSAREACGHAAIVAGDVACALLDLDLGDGDGSDVAAHLRARCADLPVAFFSAAVAEGTLTRARAIGPVFAKPQELDAAVAWVRTHAPHDAGR